MIVGIIPARGGSKRIPRKNVRLFRGKPMIAYTIEAARASDVFDQIIVSTDDAEIAEVALAFGADRTMLRPPSLANDTATTTAVMQNAVLTLTEGADNCPQFACCLYATAPLMQPETIRSGLDTLRQGGWRFAFSAIKFDYPIFRSFEISDDGVRMFHPEHANTRSQDLPEAWHDAGQFYWGTCEAWLSGTPLFNSGSTVVELPRSTVVDIDTEEDWKFAELLATAASSLQSR